MINKTLELMACLLIFVATIVLIVGGGALACYLMSAFFSMKESVPEAVTVSTNLEPQPTPFGLSGVKVGSWGHRRKLSVGPGAVGLQVTLSACGSCTTCRGRVREIREGLQKSGVAHQWLDVDGALWLFLPHTDGQDPLSYLGSVLGVTIRKC